MPDAADIDGVVRSLDEIIEWSRENGARAGYFAALYRRVTVRVREEIGKGAFESGPRMEKLDVTFANRYLRAFDAWRSGRAAPLPWATSFAATRRTRPIVLQHLLLGMNAHINVDLGIAAAQTCPGAALPGLKRDFGRINALLASLFGEVRAELCEIWTTLRLFDRLLGPIEGAVVNFSMEEARANAWRVAERAALTPDPELSALIESLDREAEAVARRILHPGFPLTPLLGVVRVGERGDVCFKIDSLAAPVRRRARPPRRVEPAPRT